MLMGSCNPAFPLSVPGLRQWDGVTEMWYGTFEDRKRSIIDEPPVHTTPEWVEQSIYPLVTPERNFVSTFPL